MKGDDLAERLLDFAVAIINLAAALPDKLTGRHIGGQLVRAATSAGANYEEGRGAESRADFVHKLAITWKEMRESRFWLRLVHRAQLIDSPQLGGLLQEADELCAILSRSLQTARTNAAKGNCGKER